MKHSGEITEWMLFFSLPSSCLYSFWVDFSSGDIFFYQLCMKIQVNGGQFGKQKSILELNGGKGFVGQFSCGKKRLLAARSEAGPETWKLGWLRRFQLVAGRNKLLAATRKNKCGRLTNWICEIYFVENTLRQWNVKCVEMFSIKSKNHRTPTKKTFILKISML